MKGLIVRWLILSAAIILASYLMDGIYVSGFFSAWAAAAFLGILNVFLRPVLIILTLPINILTLGCFTFIINAVLLEMASGVIPGFEVYGFGSAVWGSLIISIANWILNSMINERGKFETHYFQRQGPFPRRENFTKPDKKNDTIDLTRKDDDSWE